MDTRKKNILALIGMSFPFFGLYTGFIVMVFLYYASMIVPLTDYINIYSVIGLIPLCCGIVFLGGTRTENPSWYLGIPLILAFAVITVTPLVSGILVIRDPSPPIYHPGVLWSILSQIIVIFFLPLSATLFLWSQKRLGKWVPPLTLISLLITLNALIVCFYALSPHLVSAGLLPQPQPVYIDGHPVRSDGPGMLFLGVQFMVGSPLLGVCFLALAALYYRSAFRTVLPPLAEVSP
jgi:hypothetical protein